MYFSLALEIIAQTSRKKIRQFFPLLLSIGLSGCLGTSYLKENEKMLYRQTIKAPKGFSTEGLDDLMVQKTNRRFLGLPIHPLVWMYHQGQEWYGQDKSMFSRARLIRRKEKTERKFDRKINQS